jgi:transposase
VVGVEQWAEIGRLRFVRGLSIREISRRTGLRRETIRRAISSNELPRYPRAGRGSELDPFKEEIARLLREDCDLPGVRVAELLESLGWDGGKTILDDYLREVRPLFRAARTTQRTIYRPGEICQFDIFGDEVTAAAMIDRLVHHAEILALKGDSYRLKDRDLARATPTDS